MSARKISPAAARNVRPILAVLAAQLPRPGRVLEVASGTGQHVVAFAEAFPDCIWLPSDPSPLSRASIAAWRDGAKLGNVAAPLDLDVGAPDWTAAIAGPLDTIIAINLCHISPWAATEGLLAGASKLLAPGGLLYIYGPFAHGGRHISPSNAAFDLSLRRQDPAWGVRDVDAVAREAEGLGFALDEAVAMPANNFSLLIRRSLGGVGGQRELH